jgi:hypothetical protein
MATAYTETDTICSNAVTAIKAAIDASSDWTEIATDIMKCTTTRGAQMVVDLTDAAASTARMQIAFYRTHDGTTGVDKITRYLNWQAAAGTNVLHYRVSAGKEHLYVDVEGPRWNETGTPDGNHGGGRQNFAMSDVVPYHAGDTTPAVAVNAQTVDNVNAQTLWWMVSRSADNLRSWVTARPMILGYPNAAQSPYFYNRVNKSMIDGKDYLSPYVLFEEVDGIRGRLAKFFNAGWTYGARTGDASPVPGTTLDYGGEGYKLLVPHRGANNFHVWDGFGQMPNNQTGQNTWGNGPVVAVPDGT